ncbi:MAG: putative FecR, partial [Acidobacteria bacterium]|nr:putative FecR [Acidobacteriota bacterium]
ALTVTFKGPRMGMASFLANSGSGGAAEYVPGDVIAAGYVSTREPKQMFEEMLALMTRSDPSAAGRLTQVESALGVSFTNDLAASVGTESAFGVDSISTKGPVWMMAVLVNNPATLDNCIRRLVEAWNAERAREGQLQRITIEQETTNGRTWMSVKSSAAPMALVWTYDRGYMVAGSDRGIALRAIATRNGGSPLVWSQSFQQQLSGSTGLHPSGFAWLNTKGAFQGYAALVPNPALRSLIMEQDPILIAFSATEEQIRAASRTRLSRLIMDMMLLRGLGKTQAETQPAE